MNEYVRSFQEPIILFKNKFIDVWTDQQERNITCALGIRALEKKSKICHEFDIF